MSSEIQYSYYRQFGNRIFFRYKEPDSSETHSIVIDDYAPTLYTASQEKTNWKNLYGVYMQPHQFETIKDAKAFVEVCKSTGRTVFGNADYGSQFIIDMYDGKHLQFDMDRIKWGAIDIEVDIADIEGFPEPHLAEAPISVITIFNSIKDKYFVFGLNPDPERFDFAGTERHERLREYDIEYVEFTCERELIRAFLTHMKNEQYDMTTGWNSEAFDMPYIYYRSCKIVGETYLKKCLSPFNKITIKEMRDKHQNPLHKVTVVGVPHLDYMLAYQKFNKDKQSSYKLDDIGNVDLGIGKLEKSEGLKTLYGNDYIAYVEYNIIDVVLLPKLEAAKQFITTAYLLMGDSLGNLEDALGTVRIWDQKISLEMYGRGVVPLFESVDKNARDFEGGYVKEPVPGKYFDVLSVDLNSLYPKIISGSNIGPETRVHEEDIPEELMHLRKASFEDFLYQCVDTSLLKKYNLVVSPSGEFYRQDVRSLIGELLEEIYARRKKVKKEGQQHERNKLEALGEIEHRANGENDKLLGRFADFTVEQLQEYAVQEKKLEILKDNLQLVQKIFQSGSLA